MPKRKRKPLTVRKGTGSKKKKESDGSETEHEQTAGCSSARELSADVDIEMQQNGTLSILQGSTIKLSARINNRSTEPISLYWQKMEGNIGKNIPVHTGKYSNSTCDLSNPELTITDVDVSDAGIYRLEIRGLTEVIQGSQIVIEVLPGLSREENNFIRFFMLCQKLGTESVRHYFDRKIPPQMLYGHLNIHYNSLTKNRSFTAEQVNILYSGSQVVCKSADFDFILLYSLIRNTMQTKIPPPTQGWGNLPQPGNKTEEDDIERIRHYRNTMAHKTDLKILDSEFNEEWIDLSQAIDRLSLGRLKTEVLILKTVTCIYNTEVETCSKEDVTNIKDEIEVMKKVKADQHIRPNIRDQMEKIILE